MASDYAGNLANTVPGSNQYLKQGTNYGPNVTARSNKVQAGQLPSYTSRPAHAPTQAAPLGLTLNDK